MVLRSFFAMIFLVDFIVFNVLYVLVFVPETELFRKKSNSLLKMYVSAIFFIVKTLLKAESLQARSFNIKLKDDNFGFKKNKPVNVTE